MNKFAYLLPCVLGSAACHDATYFEYSNAQLGPTPVMLTSASVRLVTDRINPTGGQPAHVICTEPSPDVAKAFQSAVDVSANIAGKGSGDLAQKSAEQLAQLTARLPSIQALRDAVFRACEAYANGVLGANAYAMMVARYGELLVTLMLGENAAGNFGKDLVTLQGIDLSIQAKPSAQSPSGGTTNQKAPAGAQTSDNSKAGGADAGAGAAVATLAAKAASQPADTGQYLLAVTSEAAAAGPTLAAANPDHSATPGAAPADMPAAGGAVPGGAAAGDKAAGDKSAGGAPAGDKAAGAAKGGAGGKGQKQQAKGSAGQPKAGSDTASASTAQQLEKMQENYLQMLTYVGPMMAACMNMMDTSRPQPQSHPDTERFLVGFCEKLMNDLETLDIDHFRKVYQIGPTAAAGGRHSRK